MCITLKVPVFRLDSKFPFSNSPSAIHFPSATFFSSTILFPFKASHTKEPKAQKPKAKASNKKPKAKSPKAKKPLFLLQQDFYIQCKQGGAVVLRERGDIVIRETCLLRRSSCSAFSSSVAGAVPISAYK
jgi:hypothetical protein